MRDPKREQERAQRLDRRRFLVGAGGAALALPMLEAFAPRTAFAQTAAPPKRLIVVMHGHGRIIGNGHEGGDDWSPGAPGPLSAGVSPMLSELSDIRNELVTIDHIDNLSRHTTGHADGHFSASRTSLTARRMNGDGTASGPSIDYVAGLRLRASAAQRTALVFPATPTADNYYHASEFYGEAGSPPSTVSTHPRQAIETLFGPPVVTGPAPVKTLRERLTGRRGSILDAVARNYEGLRNQVSASDRLRLDQHASFIRTLETRFSGSGGGVTLESCSRPDEADVPTYTNTQISRGRLDHVVTPFQIENLVMSLACDVTRVASLHFQMGHDPTFSGEFAGPSPFDAGNDYHTMLHDTQDTTDPNGPALRTAFQHYTKMFKLLIQRLAAVQDTDGSRLLDNTLVLWVSDMGYGSSHYDFNIPVIMAGMRSAFPQGQGRHIAGPRRTTGDLYAQVLRMLGGSDTTFGDTGTLGSVSGLSTQGQLNAWSGFGWSYITASLGMHLGAIDL